MDRVKHWLPAALLLAALSLAPARAAESGDRNQRIDQLIRQNQLAEAEALAQQWVELEPVPRAWYTLGTILFLEKKYIEAYPTLQKGLRGQAGDPVTTARIYEMLGRIDWAMKNYDPALAWLKDATLLPGLPPETRQRLEDVHRKVLVEKGFTTWHFRSTPAIEFHYPPGPESAAAIDGVVKDYTAVVDNFVKAFPVPTVPKIQFYYYDDPEFFHLAYPDQAHSFIYLTEQGIHGFPEPRLKHEFYHLLIYRIRNGNYPSYFISEGFAEYLRRRDAGEPLHDGAAAMLATRGLPPFPQVDQLDVYENDVPWSWDLVASFTGFLVERHGMEKYLALWHSAKGLAKDCPAIFGSSFDDLYRQWTDFLRARPLPPGTLWRPLEEELLAPGLYADALAELDRFPPADRWVLLLRARACAGLGRYPEALAAVRRLGQGPVAGEGFPPAVRTQALLLAGRLHDIGGERAVALACYQAVAGLGTGSAADRDAAAAGLKTPITPATFPHPPAPDAAQQAQYKVRYAVRTGLSTPDLLAAVLANLPPDKLVLLFRDLDTPLQRRAAWLQEAAGTARSLERPEKFAAAWDAYSAGPIDLEPAREILRQDLAGFVPERCLAKIREAGISIVDLAGCLQSRK
jgi:tetratricopeptide (TPR) repeat protein